MKIKKHFFVSRQEITKIPPKHAEGGKKSLSVAIINELPRLEFQDENFCSHHCTVGRNLIGFLKNGKKIF